jgi:hypothetical protein
MPPRLFARTARSPCHGVGFCVWDVDACAAARQACAGQVLTDLFESLNKMTSFSMEVPRPYTQQADGAPSRGGLRSVTAGTRWLGPKGRRG